MIKNKEVPYKKFQKNLRLVFVLGVALIIISALVLSVAIEYLSIELGVLNGLGDNWFTFVLVVAIISIIIGCCLSFFASKIILTPISNLLNGMSNLANGKYNTRLGNSNKVRESQIVISFNNLAKELENVEILRNDFINNFSHEFKTPLVSLKGLIGLMKNKNLSKDKQREYFEIIEEEINRLSLMTTNVLNLSKLDSQTTLKDVKKYNVSEQIRRCVLLLEKGWVDKNLSLTMDFDEQYITADEDLMKEVFLNLLDNAIKYSYNNTELCITIKNDKDRTIISIIDEGEIIKEEDKERIFNKFYQVNRDRSKSGNGIGLSVVKRIIELHNGRVEVLSVDNKTTFKVII